MPESPSGTKNPHAFCRLFIFTATFGSAWPTRRFATGVLTFFQTFFLVGNHPLGAPYIKPFTEQKASNKSLWLNENVAGSYAPSSLRPDQPFRQVVSIQEKKYSLPPDHAQRAFEHLLYSIPVQVADLAVVLYRDFGLLGDSFTINDLINVFSYEFGYSDESGDEPNQDFHGLFSRQSAESWKGDWLELR